jgi:hypothetical protein
VNNVMAVMIDGYAIMNIMSRENFLIRNFKW